jgi:hypothetical protein
MKYATLLLGLATLVASVIAAAACDHYIFVCKPGQTEVYVLLSDGTKECNEAVKKEMFSIGDKSFPQSSPLFRFSQRGEKDTLDYRGQRCAGPF